MSFISDIKRFQQTCEKEAVRRLRKIGMVALKKVVLRTPVKTGCARSNWNVGVNREDTSFNSAAKGKSGGESINRGTPIIMNAKLGDIVYLINTCPYIVSLERGHSRQRPAGFLKLCQQEVQKLIDKGAL